MNLFTVNKAQRHYHSDKMWCLKGPKKKFCFDISQNQVSRYSINEDLLYMPIVYFSCFEKTSAPEGTYTQKIFALCSISLIKMSSYNITLGKNGPNLIVLNINNVI